MVRVTMKSKIIWRIPPLMLVALGLFACDDVGTGPRRDTDPRNLDGLYEWVFDRLVDRTPQGHPTVRLFWDLPVRHRNEVFRVYSRGRSGGYRLIATVTSCRGGECTYVDVNVASGQSYDYYIAAYDERSDREVGVSDAIRVVVPRIPDLVVPGQPGVTALDGAVFVQWQSSGVPLYRLWVQESGGELFAIGETDGLNFLDTRAENGGSYSYFISAVDESGHLSDLAQTPAAFPRPDYHSEILHVHADHPAASGFRFVTAETLDPIVPGTSPEAQLRLEVVNGVLRIQPLGQTAITAGTFTTQLTCGPGSDHDCVDVRIAPPASQFGFAPVEVHAGNTYVLRVVGTDGRTHFAKIRVQGTSVDDIGRRLLVFDWAYQLRPDEPSLNLAGQEGNIRGP